MPLHRHCRILLSYIHQPLHYNEGDRNTAVTLPPNNRFMFTLQSLRSAPAATSSVLLLLALSACGGGGVDSAPYVVAAPPTAATTPVTPTPVIPPVAVTPVTATPTVPPVTATPTVPPVTAPPAVVSAARIASVGLAQSHLFLSTDSALVLISGKSALVMVNATTTKPTEAKPAGTVRVETAAGVLVQSIDLTLPTAALAASVPDVPSFTTAYNAILPANLVKSGMQLTISLANGQTATVVKPRVGGGVPMTLVAVPVQMGSLVGEVLANAGSYMQAVAPLQSVTYRTHAIYVSKTKLPTIEADWSSAMSAVLSEMAGLYYLEGAQPNTYYYGFVPKRSYGQTGVGFAPGNAAVGFDLPTAPEVVLQTLIHELGHNFSLDHAPCGGPNYVDPQFPYQGGFLGAPGRYIWGYNLKTSTFIDPRDTNLHDTMSYCYGMTFSDYNYRKMQTHLTPADALVIAGATVPAAGPQQLLMVSGQVTAGQAELKPVKSMVGEPRLPQSGPYTLRIVGEQGTVDYPFTPLAVDHDAKFMPFVFTVPHPGTIYSMTLLKDGKVLTQRAAPAAAGAVDSAAASARTAATVSPPQVLATEKAGVLTLSWDHSRHPYLTVTHVGKQRQSMAQDLTGGKASIELGALPAGGSFEFGLSDGLNTVLLTVAR